MPHRKLPDRNLYETKEEAEMAYVELMLENIYDTPYGNDWTVREVIDNAAERYPYLTKRKIRELLLEDLDFNGDELWNDFLERKEKYYKEEN